MPAPILQIKRGAAANIGIASLRAGEPGFTTDKYDFYIGLNGIANNQKFFGSHRYWEREDGTNSLRLRLVAPDGDVNKSIQLKTPNNHTGITTYTFPSTPDNGKFLSVDGSGNLSWQNVTASAAFSNATLTGITTINGSLNNTASTTNSGVTTFTNTTDNTLGNSNTGAVQIDGGVGIDKNLTVGANLYVGGYSEFVGVVTFRGGTINIGDGTGDDINVGGEFISGLFPNTTNTYDLGDGTRQWRHGNFAGIITASTGAVLDDIRIGISGVSEIDTTSGNLTLDSATGTTIIDDNLEVYGNINCTGNVSVGGTTITLRGTDVFIENKDIILGYTTSITPNDDTANHAGVAIASTIGTPLVSFTASGINTLPDTYKQLMWFKSGTLGFSTDAFAFNYGVAIGTTTMASGVRLAVGSGITMSDTSISATNFYGSLVGNASSADQVKTVSAANNPATYYLTFVDANNGSATNETVYTDDGIYYNPGTNTFTTQHAVFTGIATVQSSFTVGTGVGITQFSGSVSTGTSTSSVPTSSAIINYVGSQVGNIDLTLGINADTGGPSTVNTSQILTISGTVNEVNTSVSGQTITVGLPDAVVVGTSLSVPTIKTATVQHSTGTQAATIDSSGNITASQNLTVSGSLFVNGSTTQVNTTELTVYDRTITLGVTTAGTTPITTSWDLGVLMNYGDAGVAKTAGVIWKYGNNDVERFQFATNTNNPGSGGDVNAPDITVSTFAPIEIGSLWMNDTAGQNVIASYLSLGGLYTNSPADRYLQNITVDAGTF